MKELSIIIPVYNVENFITECLNSIISQTYDNFECIIVDDCSPDRSADIASDIINHYQGNIEFKLLHHDTNKGPSAARNIGIQQSTTDYVFFLDSDDRLYPNSIETLVNELKRHTNADIIDGEVIFFGAIIFIDTSKNTTASNNIPIFIGHPTATLSCEKPAKSLTSLQGASLLS